MLRGGHGGFSLEGVQRVASCLAQSQSLDSWPLHPTRGHTAIMSATKTTLSSLQQRQPPSHSPGSELPPLPGKRREVCWNRRRLQYFYAYFKKSNVQWLYRKWQTYRLRYSRWASDWRDTQSIRPGAHVTHSGRCPQRGHGGVIIGSLLTRKSNVSWWQRTSSFDTKLWVSLRVQPAEHCARPCVCEAAQ